MEMTPESPGHLWILDLSSVVAPAKQSASPDRQLVSPRSFCPRGHGRRGGCG